MNLIQKNKNIDANQINEVIETSDYERLGDRQATALESAIRNKNSQGIFTAVFLVFTVVLFVNYWFCAQSYLFILMIISGLFAIFFYWHKSIYYRVDVSHIKAKIKKNSHKKQITVGDDLIVNYPSYWQSFIPEKTLASEEMDVIISEGKLLSYDNLSINDEIEQFGAPKFVLRNLILFVVGLIASIVIFLLSNSVYYDLFSYYPFDNKVKVWNFTDATSLKNSTIQKGDLLNINMGGASYEAYDNSNLDDSKIVYINNQPANNSKLVKVDFMMMKKLFDDNLVKTSRDDAVIQQETQLKNEIKEKTNHESRFQKDYDYVDYSLIKLSNINELISVVDESCQLFEKDNTDYLKIFLMETLLPSGKKIDKWDDLVKYSQQHPDYEEIVNAERVENITNLISYLQEAVLNYYIEQLNLELETYQHSQQSVSLALINNKNIEIIQPDVDNNSIVGMIIIQRYYDALKGIGGKVKIAGIVDDINYADDHSVSSLIINDAPPFNKNNEKLVSLVSPILISILLFSVTTLIAFANAMILCWKLVANLRRRNMIFTTYSNRKIQSDTAGQTRCEKI